MSDGPRVPAPLPESRVDYGKLSARRWEIGITPTAENSPEVFVDELAEVGFAAAQVEPFVPAATLIADHLDGRHAIDLALRTIRFRAVRQWLWTNRERIRVRGRALVLPGLTADERTLLEYCRGELLKLLRDEEVLDWFKELAADGNDNLRPPHAGVRATQALSGPV